MIVNKINREKIHDRHFLIKKNLDDEFKKVIESYNNFGNTNTKDKGFDRTTYSELVRMLIYNFIQEYNNNPNPDFQLMDRLSEYRGKEKERVRELSARGGFV